MRNVWKCALGLLVDSAFWSECQRAIQKRKPSHELNIPRVSQRGTVSQRIGLTDITITYHRPEVVGGNLGQDSALGKVWRTGANENTTITFSDDVSVEGKTSCRGHVWTAHHS